MRPRTSSSSRVPDPADGVVGGAEDEQPAGGVDLRPQVVEVHRVAPAVEPERIADHAAAVVLDGVIEGMIDGRLEDDRVTRLGEGPDDEVQGRHQARRHGQPARFDGPAVPPAQPARRGLEERRRGLRVAEDAVRDPPREGLDDGGRGLEVHVGDPHRDGVRDAQVPAGVDPLHGLGPRPVDDLVKWGHDTHFPISRVLFGFTHVHTSPSQFSRSARVPVGVPGNWETGIMSPIK